MNKFGRRILAALITSSLVVTPVFAAPSVDDLQKSKASAQSEVNSLQSQLQSIVSKITQLEADLTTKGEEIIQAQADLEAAEEKKEEQKEEVKIIEEQSNNKAPKNETNKLLQEIVMVLKQQNNEIKELKKTINPNEPKMIVNKNGEPCLSNSSVDCFDIPVIQEGRNVPVLYDFIKEPNENNAKAWLLYQANLFNHYIKMGYALKFAAINGDENTYPVNALNLYGASKDNMTFDLYRDRILEILHAQEPCG